MKKPTKEFDLPWESAGPDECGPFQVNIVSMEELICSTACEGGQARAEQPSLVRGVKKLGGSNGVQEDMEFIRCLLR